MTDTTARRLLWVILVLGLIGTETELILLNHVEDVRQWIPVILLGAGFFALLWHRLMPNSASAQAVRSIMFGFLAGGLAGIYFHYQGSAEFKLESNPSLGGWDLFWAAVRAKAPPLLAPGEMLQLGLLGLLYIHINPGSILGEQTGESK
jgi:hypothetical protein